MSIIKEDPKDSPTAWCSVRLGFFLNTKETTPAIGRKRGGNYPEISGEVFRCDRIARPRMHGIMARLWENFGIRVRHGLEGKHC